MTRTYDSGVYESSAVTYNGAGYHSATAALEGEGTLGEAHQSAAGPVPIGIGRRGLRHTEDALLRQIDQPGLRRMDDGVTGQPRDG